MMEKKPKYSAPSHYNKLEKEIWEVLIYKDFVAFCNQDWRFIEDDFLEKGFFGISGHKSEKKSDWSLTYPTLASYQSDWINASMDFGSKKFKTDPLDILFEGANLTKIQIIDDCALVHKSFDCQFELLKEEPIIFDWVSIFLLRKIEGKWKIASFTGYLPK